MFPLVGYGIAWNMRLEITNTISLNRYSSGNTSLDIVAPPYYNQGYTTFSATITPD
jgi:hypothetical protein